MPLARLRTEVAHAQKRMVAALALARDRFEQGGDRGTAGAEVPFRSFLQDYLPPSYGVGHGEIVDADGHISTQTDVVIVDPDHPFTYTPAEPGLFFIDGVAAAGEVKSVLTTGDLDRTLANSRRFKELTPRHPRGTLIQSTPSDVARFYDRRPCFLIAFESQLKPETIATKIHAFGQAHPGEPILDAVYVLDRGWVVDFGDGQGAFKFGAPGEEPATGWVAQEIPEGEVLFDFLSGSRL
jgi:hypothetical protein